MMGMTIIDVRGFGRQRGDKGTNGMKEEEVRFLPKLKLEILVRDWDVEHTMDTLAETLRTGNIGDGKIVVFDASSAMRVRTGEKGIRAVYGEEPKSAVLSK
jgi:nitrogen regulatory protein PII